MVRRCGTGQQLGAVDAGGNARTSRNSIKHSRSLSHLGRAPFLFADGR
nr:MAG TPA: hypothetical protein [Caudoviricetes sp.]